MGVDRHADDPAWRLPDKRLARGEEGRVRTAIAHGDAEPLGAADDDVGAHFTGRHRNREREQIGGDGDEHVLFVCARDERAKIHERAVIVGRLHVGAEHVAAELR